MPKIYGTPKWDKLLKKLKEDPTILDHCRFDLSNNGINDAGAEELAVVLQNTSLTWLDLSNNSIGAIGAKALIEKTPLTHLILWNNLINEADVKEIAKALKQNTSLIQLELHNQYTNLDDIIQKTIKPLLKRNMPIEKSYREIQKAARILAQGKRDLNSLFYKLPNEINIQIASETRNTKMHNFDEAYKIAGMHFCKPTNSPTNIKIIALGGTAALATIFGIYKLTNKILPNPRKVIDEVTEKALPKCIII